TLVIEFAMTLAGAVLVSGFVALPLTPMMCSKLLRHNANPGRLFAMVERGFTAFEHGYRRTLTRSLQVRHLVLIGALAVAAAGGLFLYLLQAELAPVEDRGAIQVRGVAPEGAPRAFTNRYAIQVGRLLEQIPELQYRLLLGGTPEGRNPASHARLNDCTDRSRR